ncbi:MAG: hypothetical protein EXR98_12135 [Gemmataceae bacterium]|nr:hypothetical protein [Gemmataceae bacterium]
MPADLPLVALDASSLQTAVAELGNNTSEATKNQGAIRFKARVTELTAPHCRELGGAATPGPYVELTITDDGPSFAPEQRAKLRVRGADLFQSIQT